MAESLLIPAEQIERSIRFIRGEKIMLDKDLPGLYGVATKVLVQAVKRNRAPVPGLRPMTSSNILGSRHNGRLSTSLAT